MRVKCLAQEHNTKGGAEGATNKKSSRMCKTAGALNLCNDSYSKAMLKVSKMAHEDEQPIGRQRSK